MRVALLLLLAGSAWTAIGLICLPSHRPGQASDSLAPAEPKTFRLVRGDCDFKAPFQPAAVARAELPPVEAGVAEPLAGPAPAVNREEALTETPLENHEPGKAMRELRESAERSPAAALDAAMAWPEEERADALAAVCFGLAQRHPSDAVQLAQTLGQPESTVAELVQQWAGADLLSALVWTHEQPEGAARDECFERVAFVLSRTDPENAGTLVAEQIPPGPAQDEAVIMVVHQWATQDVLAAARWVRGFPAGLLRERALDELRGMVEQ